MNKREATLIIESWNRGGFTLDYKSKMSIGLFGKDRFAVPKGDVMKLLEAVLVLSKPIEDVEKLIQELFSIYQNRTMTPDEFRDHLRSEIEKFYNRENILTDNQNGKT